MHGNLPQLTWLMLMALCVKCWLLCRVTDEESDANVNADRALWLHSTIQAYNWLYNIHINQPLTLWHVPVLCFPLVNICDVLTFISCGVFRCVEAKADKNHHSLTERSWSSTVIILTTFSVKHLALWLFNIIHLSL